MSKEEKQISRIKVVMKACDEVCDKYDSEELCTMAIITAYQHICKIINSKEGESE